MNNSSPLLNFKEKAKGSSFLSPKDVKYDMNLGYWICKDGEPLINKMINSKNNTLYCQTTLTKTRESIDQIESSKKYYFHLKYLKLLLQNMNFLLS